MVLVIIFVSVAQNTKIYIESIFIRSKIFNLTHFPIILKRYSSVYLCPNIKCWCKLTPATCFKEQRPKFRCFLIKFAWKVQHKRTGFSHFTLPDRYSPSREGTRRVVQPHIAYDTRKSVKRGVISFKGRTYSLKLLFEKRRRFEAIIRKGGRKSSLHWISCLTVRSPADRWNKILFSVRLVEHANVSGASSERGRNIRLALFLINFKATSILTKSAIIRNEIESSRTIVVFQVMTNVFGGVLCSNLMENRPLEIGIRTIVVSLFIR